MNVPLLFGPFVNWWIFGLFPLLGSYYHYFTNILWIMLQSAFVYMFLSIYVFLFFLGTYLGVEFLGPYGNSMFNVLRDHQTVFQSSCSIVHSHQCCLRIQISLHPFQCFFVCFLHYSHPGRLKWYHLVLVCISLMAKMLSIFCLLASHISSLEKCV